jgi:hypothetical protein
MIRLKDILLEYEDSHEKQLNVLFVVDDQSLKKFGFIRHIISQRVVVGEIESADKQNSEALKDIVITQASPELDLIVVISRGIYDDEPLRVIRNFDIISQYADTIDIPVLFFNVPTIRFIKDKAKLSNNWSEIERIKLNNIISRRYDNTVNLSNIDQDEYFQKNGFSYNLNAHLTLYETLFKKILKFDENAEETGELVTGIKCNISKLHVKLISLGYDIDVLEMSKQLYGETTRQAVDELKSKMGYRPGEELSTSICNAIMLLQPEEQKEKKEIIPKTKSQEKQSQEKQSQEKQSQEKEPERGMIRKAVDDYLPGGKIINKGIDIALDALRTPIK